MESTISKIKACGIPQDWTNTMQMQSSFSLNAKGFSRKVSWKPSTISGASIGLFAEEFIPKGDVFRVAKKNQNMIVFNGPDDIPPLTDATIKYIGDYCFQCEDMCAIMIPGNSINHHHTRCNVTGVKISEEEAHCFATQDIQCGEELLNNYAEDGTPPSWLAELAKKHNMPLIFKEYNDYV